MKIPCSSCNQRLEIPEELAGQTIECPACKASLAVPTIEAPPSATSQVQATAPQVIEPQKSAQQRQISASSKGASTKKSKLPIPKWAIASVTGVAIVVLTVVIFNGSKPQAPNISIQEATAERNIKAVKQHIEAGTNVNAKGEWENLDGWTPLCIAAAKGSKEIAELLITAGADVNLNNHGRQTPLHFATKQSHKEVVELLIINGAKVNIRNASGMTPLDWCIIKNQSKTADLLRKHGGKTGEELKAEGK